MNFSRKITKYCTSLNSKALAILRPCFWVAGFVGGYIVCKNEFWTISCVLRTCAPPKNIGLVAPQKKKRIEINLEFKFCFQENLSTFIISCSRNAIYLLKKPMVRKRILASLLPPTWCNNFISIRLSISHQTVRFS